MIQIIEGPENTAAFRAIGEVTAEDYKNVLVPEVTRLVKKINEINFLFLIDTEIKNFTATAWLEDALLGLKNLGKWNRAAIVTDSEKRSCLQKVSAIWYRANLKALKKMPFTKL